MEKTLACVLLAAASLVAWQAQATSGAELGGRDNICIQHGSDQPSSNYSGYEQAYPSSGHFVAIDGGWNVPAVDTRLSGDQYSADWIGIGSCNGAELVQIGTEANNLDGRAEYSAWSEVIPLDRYAQPLDDLTVYPGDLMDAEIQEIDPGLWTLELVDDTTKTSIRRTVEFTMANPQVALVIHERIGSDDTKQLRPFAKTSDVSFGGVFAAVGSPKDFERATPYALGSAIPGTILYRVHMTNASGQTIASTSALSRQHCFTVAYGAQTPQPRCPLASRGVR